MNVWSKTLITMLALAAGVGAGWQAGGGKPAESGVVEVAPAPTKRGSRADASPEPDDIHQLLAPVRAAHTADERMRATLALAQSLPVSELERWYAAGWFGFHGGMESIVFQRVTRDRWLAEDPAGLVGFFLRTDHAETWDVAAAWMKRDPPAALEFLKSMAGSADVETLAHAMEEALVATDPELAVKQVSWLAGVSESGFWGNSLGETIIDTLGKTRPDLLEREYPGWPEELQQIALKNLDGLALKRDFDRGLAALSESPDAKQRFVRAVRDSKELLWALVVHSDVLPPGWFAAAAAGSELTLTKESPGKWLAEDLEGLGFSDDQAADVRRWAIFHLGSDDPRQGLELLSGGSLSEDERKWLLKCSLETLAKENAGETKEWVARLTDPEEIALAEQAIEQALEESPPETVPTPTEWIARFAANAEDPDTDFTAVWARTEITEATQAFRDLPAERKGKVAESLIEEAGDEIPPELSAEALGFLLSHPPPEDRMDAEALGEAVSEHVVSWAAQDPLAAGRWVSSLPEGDARLWAAKNLAAHWAEYETAAAKQWAASLPAADRKEVMDYLDSGAAWKP